MSTKKLYLSQTDKKIAGVCGGIAEYLDVDATVIRIIFLVALICASFGFWAYIIVWIAAPKGPEEPGTLNQNSNPNPNNDYIRE
ncbi:MAG: PspC domain-containing protein [Bacteroidales bacterium]|nr:PspC domain-containing protein [Bacteroidales bacterium]